MNKPRPRSANIIVQQAWATRGKDDRGHPLPGRVSDQLNNGLKKNVKKLR